MIIRSMVVEAYVAFSALCQASHVFKPAAPPPLSNLVAKSPSHQVVNLLHSTMVDIMILLRCDWFIYVSFGIGLRVFFEAGHIPFATLLLRDVSKSLLRSKASTRCHLNPFARKNAILYKYVGTGSDRRHRRSGKGTEPVDIAVQCM